MPNIQEGEIVKESIWKQNLTKKHSSYFSTVWSISVVLGYIAAFVDWFQKLFLSAHDGNFVGFILLFLFQSLFMAVSGIIGAVIIFLILIVITIVPYLIFRGLTR